MNDGYEDYKGANVYFGRTKVLGSAEICLGTKKAAQDLSSFV